MAQNTLTDTNTINHMIQPQKCVLIVDDNYASRLVAKVLLERENYTVALAANGKDAIALASMQIFDLILMDIQMPIMDGFETARAIKHTSDLNSETIIIALTAYADIAVKKDIKKAGMADMLTKPLDYEQLSTAWQSAKMEIAESKPLSLTNAKAQNNALNLKTSNHQNMCESVLNMAVIGPIVAAASATTLHRLFNSFYTSTDMSIGLISMHAQDAVTGNEEAIHIVKTEAHALKGASANVGFLGLSATAAKIQGVPQDLVEIALPHLRLMLKLSQAELYDYLERNFALAI